MTNCSILLEVKRLSEIPRGKERTYKHELKRGCRNKQAVIYSTIDYESMCVKSVEFYDSVLLGFTVFL